MNSIKSKLSATFKMRDLGPASYILRIAISRDQKMRTISLSQKQYINQVVERCGMSNSKPIWTPMAPNTQLLAENPDGNNTSIFKMKIGDQNVSYASIVGSIMYAVMGTQPDLAYTVGGLGRFSSNPKAHHWTAAKRALCYLNATANMVLRFDGNDVSMDTDYKNNSNFSFHGFSDTDWSGDCDTSRSTSGFVFITARGAIGWGSKRQSLVALSSTKSEYIGLCCARQHLAWLRTFFEDVGHKQETLNELFCDNQAAIVLTKDAQY